MMNETLYLASTNPGKLREFREGARRYAVNVEILPGIRDIPACVEDGTTFEANARKKALYYSAQVGGWVFADDSGLEVDALGGTPGVHSARYAGPNADDASNNAKLMGRLREVPPASRTAHYVCVIALAGHGRVIAVTEGRADGTITESARGSRGFGYDPYFLYPPLGKTFAELNPGDKWSVSHRGEAFRRLLDHLSRNAPEHLLHAQ